MDDGLANGRHPERLAGLGLDEALEPGVPHHLSGRPQLRLAHHAADQVVRHLSEGRGRAERQDGYRDDRETAQGDGRHLNTYRTRTSSA